MAAELAHGEDIGHFLGIRVEREPLGHLPYEYFSIVGRRGDDRIVEGVPIRWASDRESSSPGGVEVGIARARDEAGSAIYAPVGVQHGRGVAAEQGNLVGQLASFAEGDDGERTAAAGLPIDS